MAKLSPHILIKYFYPILSKRFVEQRSLLIHRQEGKRQQRGHEGKHAFRFMGRVPERHACYSTSKTPMEHRLLLLCR